MRTLHVFPPLALSQRRTLPLLTVQSEVFLILHRSICLTGMCNAYTACTADTLTCLIRPREKLTHHDAS